MFLKKSVFYQLLAKYTEIFFIMTKNGEKTLKHFDTKKSYFYFSVNVGNFAERVWKLFNLTMWVWIVDVFQDKTWNKLLILEIIMILLMLNL